jgi:hypothetical protein
MTEFLAEAETKIDTEEMNDTQNLSEQLNQMKIELSKLEKECASFKVKIEKLEKVCNPNTTKKQIPVDVYKYKNSLLLVSTDKTNSTVLIKEELKAAQGKWSKIQNHNGWMFVGCMKDVSDDDIMNKVSELIDSLNLSSYKVITKYAGDLTVKTVEAYI